MKRYDVVGLSTLNSSAFTFQISIDGWTGHQTAGKTKGMCMHTSLPLSVPHPHEICHILLSNQLKAFNYDQVDHIMGCELRAITGLPACSIF